MSTDNVRLVCPYCGSEDITRDGLLSWDVPTQAWVAAGELDIMDCNACGDEFYAARELRAEPTAV